MWRNFLTQFLPPIVGRRLIGHCSQKTSSTWLNWSLISQRMSVGRWFNRIGTSCCSLTKPIWVTCISPTRRRVTRASPRCVPSDLRKRLELDRRPPMGGRRRAGSETSFLPSFLFLLCWASELKVFPIIIRCRSRIILQNKVSCLEYMSVR